jgi:tRNA(fMet)-specific endonuclease VapC
MEIIALDTNQAIAVLNGAGDAGTWIRSCGEVCLPVPVIGELRYGAMNSRHAAQNQERIEKLVSRCRILEIKSTTTFHYAGIRMQLKRAGRPIPENDLWIAALCVEHSIPLATEDGHFTFVEGMDVVKR